MEITNQETPPSLISCLRHILELLQKEQEIEVRAIFTILSERGYDALLIILSLPFLFPIHIPGLSTPFGIILAFLGLRMIATKKLWWPEWILKKKVSKEKVEKLIEKSIIVVQRMQKLLHPRWQFLANNRLFHGINGLLITVLAILLSLPLPIPLTNMAAALPILCIGLGMLEDDGLAILLGYFFAFICLAFFTALLLFAKSFF